MTKEEMLVLLKEMKQNTINGAVYNDPKRESKSIALDMAIKALEQQSEDAISRQAAIDIASGFCHPANVVKELKRLPSVQPKQIECEDAISRADAIKKVSEILKCVFVEYEDVAQKAMESLPSVQPKYNASEWCHDCKEYNKDKHCCPRFNKVIRNAVEEIKQSKTGHCKDCKYFEYDHFENMGGIPLITTHKVCKRHGLICKTDEDGYCHLWEHKAEGDE